MPSILREPGVWSNGSTVLGLLAAVAATGDLAVVFAIVLGALAVVSLVISWILLGRRRTAMDRRIEALIRAASLDQVLYLTGTFLDLGANGGWRVSLYRLDVKRDCWRLVGRAASSEIYSQRGDFECVPVGVGVLRSISSRGDRPDGASDQTPLFPSREEDVEGWIRVHEVWGVESATALALRMPTRCYQGMVFRLRVDDAVGVTLALVLEADHDATHLFSGVDQILTRPYFEAVAEYLTLKSEVAEFASLEAPGQVPKPDLAWTAHTNLDAGASVVRERTHGSESVRPSI